MNSSLKARGGTKTLEDKIGEITPIDVHNCTLKLKDESIIDVGALCYTNFFSVQKTSIKWVDPTKLDSKRLDFARRLISEIRLSTAKPVSKKRYFYHISSFIEWINENGLPEDFSSEIEVRKSYEEYTKWLFYRRALKDSDKKKIKNNFASSLQKQARIACALMLDTEPRVIANWCTEIRHNDRDSLTNLLTHTPITDEERKKTYAAHCELIDQSWRYLIKKRIRIHRNIWISYL